MINLPILLLESLVWSGLWMLMVALTIRYFPWAIEHDYPQDVREAAALPNPSPQQKKRTVLFATVSFGLLFLFVILSVFLTYELKTLSFATIFLHVFIMSMTWNVVDLLVLDWLLICVCSSKFFILPKTEDCAGNKDYLHHFKGFLKGMITMTVLSLLLTGIIFLLLQLLK
ncbi:hypothetical protein [Streptococcus oricebi]|uniref:Uncharacterized protein n=1 Tax=Streptococcus oricebi TaxID=1547447 RepID=A0ABS5B357_9STRE|nr:hypothetical protein [Streptococcus oricebi]MBP2623273.1 hypothetical protein [Streptococcus oricebi]